MVQIIRQSVMGQSMGSLSVVGREQHLSTRACRTSTCESGSCMHTAVGVTPHGLKVETLSPMATKEAAV